MSNEIVQIKIIKIPGTIDVEFYLKDSPTVARSYYEFTPDSDTRNIMETIVAQLLKSYRHRKNV